MLRAAARWDSAPMSPSQPLASTAFMYVDCDVPEGMTLDAWRRRDARLPRRRSLFVRMWRSQRVVLAG
jgi:hypothetical protein